MSSLAPATAAPFFFLALTSTPTPNSRLQTPTSSSSITPAQVACVTLGRDVLPKLFKDAYGNQMNYRVQIPVRDDKALCKGEADPWNLAAFYKKRYLELIMLSCII